MSKQTVVNRRKELELKLEKMKIDEEIGRLLRRKKELSSLRKFAKIKKTIR